MKKILSLLLIPSALALTGCNITEFNKNADGSTSIRSHRFLWSTDSYTCQWNTNGASLTVNKSGVDAAALQAIGQLALQAAGTAAKP